TGGDDGDGQDSGSTPVHGPSQQDDSDAREPPRQSPEQPAPFNVEVKRNGEKELGQTETEGDQEHSGWLTVSAAAKVAGINTGTLTRAVDAGEIRSNGKRGRDRRINPGDLTRWLLARADKPEREESEEQVKRLTDKHCRD